MTDPAPCQFLAWDTDFFGFRIARVTGNQLSPDKITAINKWCNKNHIECLYFLAESGDRETVTIVEDSGFNFVDIRVTFSRPIFEKGRENKYSQTDDLLMRSSKRADIPKLQSIAREVYSQTRFHFDPNFPTEKCHEFYEQWIKNSCEGYADIVFVAIYKSRIAGYISCHSSEDGQIGKISLIGVSRENQNQGLGKQLIRHAIQWFSANKIKQIRVITQGSNIPAQRLYQSIGFRTRSVKSWYHKWF